MSRGLVPKDPDKVVTDCGQFRSEWGLGGDMVDEQFGCLPDIVSLGCRSGLGWVCLGSPWGLSCWGEL